MNSFAYWSDNTQAWISPLFIAWINAALSTGLNLTLVWSTLSFAKNLRLILWSPEPIPPCTPTVFPSKSFVDFILESFKTNIVLHPVFTALVKVIFNPLIAGTRDVEICSTITSIFPVAIASLGSGLFTTWVSNPCLAK